MDESEDGVREVAGDRRDPDIVEEWERRTAEPNFGGVYASKSRSIGYWQVSFSILEFVREEPLVSELVAAITDALSMVEGVTRVAGEDREVFAIWGTPKGDDLVRAGALALDGLEGPLRQCYEREVTQGPVGDMPMDLARQMLLLDAQQRAERETVDEMGAMRFVAGMATADRLELLTPDDRERLEKAFPGALQRFLEENPE